MAASRLGSRFVKVGNPSTVGSTNRWPHYTCLFCQYAKLSQRSSAPSRFYSGGARPSQGPFRSRLRTALQRTKVEWRPIPITLGISFLGAIQFYRVRKREQAREAEAEREEQRDHRPAKRKRIKPSGPW